MDEKGQAPGGAQPLSLRKKVLFSGIVTVVFALLGLIGVECYVRLTKPYVDLWTITGRQVGMSPMASWAAVDAFCAYRGKPGKYASAGSVTKTVNRHGFISTPEIEFEKEPGELRIAFLGESSTAGTGKDLSDGDTWPWKVAENVQKSFPDRKVTFINGAMGGYNSFESIGRLWSRIRFFHPDIVVANHGWNEMYYFTNADFANTWKVRADGSWGLDESTSEICRPIFLDHLLRYSQFATRMRLTLAAGEGAELGGEAKANAVPGDFDRRGIEVWRTNLRLLRETAKVLDTPLFVCKQPTLAVAGLSKQLQKRCHYERHHFGHAAHVEAYKAIYRVIDQEIATEQVIDLTSVSGKGELFYDHVHPTPEGTTQIAGIVAKQLVDYVAHAPVKALPATRAAKKKTVKPSMQALPAVTD